MTATDVSFGSTLTNGIQDISAFAAVFGTDMVEKQMARSDNAGYLYAAVCGMSMFGSLGSAKWALMTLLPTKWMDTAMLGDNENSAWKFNIPQWLYSDRDGIYVAEAIDDFFGARYMADFQGFKNIKVILNYLDAGVLTYLLKAFGASFAFSSLGMLPFAYILMLDMTFCWGPLLRCVGSFILSCQKIGSPYYYAWIAKPTTVYEFDPDNFRLPKPTMRQFILAAIWLLLTLIGAIMVLIGYVGSFTAVQNTSQGASTVWLSCELIQMLIRLILWGPRSRLGRSKRDIKSTSHSWTANIAITGYTGNRML